MSRRETPEMQDRTRLRLTVGGGLGILLLIAVGWFALRNQAAVPEPGLTPLMASEHAITRRPSLSESPATPQGSVKARIVFTQVRSFVSA